MSKMLKFYKTPNFIHIPSTFTVCLSFENEISSFNILLFLFCVLTFPLPSINIIFQLKNNLTQKSHGYISLAEHATAHCSDDIKNRHINWTFFIRGKNNLWKLNILKVNDPNRRTWRMKNSIFSYIGFLLDKMTWSRK